MSEYAEMLQSVTRSKRVYDDAKKTLASNTGKAEGVVNTIHTAIESKRESIARCDKGAKILATSAKLIESYSSSIMTQMYKGLEEMLTSNLASMGGNRVVIEERQQKSGKSVLDIYVMEPGKKGKEEKRDIKSDCGHGVGQLVSLFLTCSLVENSSKTKIVLLDEVVSGVSSTNLHVVDKVIEYMKQHGFIVVVNEHGFIPSNSTVYTLQNTDGVSKCISVEEVVDPVYRELAEAQ